MTYYDICPKFSNCPLYNRLIHLFSEETLEIYKRTYCLAGKDGYTKCKRYIISEALNMPAPDYVLPNSEITVEQVIERMRRESEE